MLLPLALAAMVSLALLACGTSTDAVDSGAAVAPGSNAAAVAAADAPAVSSEVKTAAKELESPLKPTVIAPESVEAVAESAMAAPTNEVAEELEATASVVAQEEKGVEGVEAVEPAATLAELDADAVVAAHGDVLAGLYKKVLPSTVHIEVAKQFGPGQGDDGSVPPQLRRFFDGPNAPEGLVPQGQGSGFVWSADGYIVTNHHVVAGADRVTVIFPDGWEVDAEVLGTDPDSDLAVLKIDVPEGGLTALELGDSAELRVGQLTLAIGAPFGQDFTMTRGIVSALGRTIPSAGSPFSNPEVVQTDAPINPGNSGGPLLDREGRLIGINSQIVSRSGSSAGIGFAVPVNTAKRVVPELIANGKYEYAYLGIQGGDLRPRVAEANGLDRGTRGVIVGPVVEDGPAANAGIVPNLETVEINGEKFPTGGDVITSVNGSTVETMADLLVYLTNNARPGDKVTLGLIRGDGELASVEVTLAHRPEPTELRPPA